MVLASSMVLATSQTGFEHANKWDPALILPHKIWSWYSQYSLKRIGTLATKKIQQVQWWAPELQLGYSITQVNAQSSPQLKGLFTTQKLKVYGIGFLKILSCWPSPSWFENSKRPPRGYRMYPFWSPSKKETMDLGKKSHTILIIFS